MPAYRIAFVQIPPQEWGGQLREKIENGQASHQSHTLTLLWRCLCFGGAALSLPAPHGGWVPSSNSGQDSAKLRRGLSLTVHSCLPAPMISFSTSISQSDSPKFDASCWRKLNLDSVKGL